MQKQMSIHVNNLQQQTSCHRQLRMNLPLFMAFLVGCSLNFIALPVYYKASKTTSYELLQPLELILDDGEKGNEGGDSHGGFDKIPSWLNNINIGRKISEGTIASVLEATLVNESKGQGAIKSGGKNYSKYIIKITGLQGGEKKNRLEKRNRLEMAFNEIDIMNIFRSAPHPSIPQMIYGVKKIPNIFKTNTTTLTLPETLEGDWKEWFLSCKVLSIAVFERAIPTNYLINRDHDILLPSSEMIYCFLNQLFDVLQHAHSHNVMIRDSHVENIIIDHGQVKLFDWNLGLIYDKSKQQYASQDHRRIAPIYLNADDSILPPEIRIKSHRDMIHISNVHAYDVYRIGGMILHIINSTYYVGGGEDDGNNNDNTNNNKNDEEDDKDNNDDFWGGMSETNDDDITTSILSVNEINDLKDMAERMMRDDPNDRPTFQELLNNHTYFKTNTFNTTTMTKNKHGKCLLEWRQKRNKKKKKKKKKT